MRQKAYVKTTKPGLVVGIIVVIAFIVFGIFFFSLLSGEPDAGIGQTFLTIWMFVLLIIGGVFVNNLINYDKNPGASVAEEIDMPGAINTHEVEISFDEKLRKIDKLRKQGLISDAEFEAKRQEIMQQKW
jgi:hypothetical protein